MRIDYFIETSWTFKYKRPSNLPIPLDQTRCANSRKHREQGEKRFTVLALNVDKILRPFLIKISRRIHLAWKATESRKFCRSKGCSKNKLAMKVYQLFPVGFTSLVCILWPFKDLAVLNFNRNSLAVNSRPYFTWVGIQKHNLITAYIQFLIFCFGHWNK